MSTLVLRLAGPMQSWGDGSKFHSRHTRSAPTKSGVLGLLAAAQGRRRTDPLEDLLSLTFGVRVDQPGQVLSDFHTAIDWAARAKNRKDGSMPLSNRYYLSDAVFLAAVEGEDDLIDGLANAVRSPRFPLFLGRRSCPVTEPVLLGVDLRGVESALTEASGPSRWQAAAWWRRRQPRRVLLEAFMDAPSGGSDTVQQRDVPLSFDPRRREYGWRAVRSIGPVRVENPEGHDRPDYLAAGSW